MKQIRLIFALFFVMLLLSQCNKNYITRNSTTPPTDSVQVNSNTQSIIFIQQILYAGKTRFGFPNLTQSILDSGSVAAYFKLSDSTAWIPLPYNDGTINCAVETPMMVGTMILVSTTTLVKYDFRFDLTKGK